MGIRSDVGVAIKTEAYNQLSDESKKVLSEAKTTDEKEEGKLFLFSYIKWYHNDDPELVQLYEELAKLGGDQYLIVDACHDYPESEDGDAGRWTDNPWNLYRAVSVSLNVDGVDWS